MQVEGFSKYQSWVQAEMECAKRVRKRKRIVFWKCIAITVVVAVVVGFVGFLLDAGSDSEAGVIAVAAVMFVVPLITLILFFCMLPGFLKGRYSKKVRRAIQQQGFSDAQREQFAQEQMMAQRDPASSVALVITGFGQDHMPAWFTLSENYACLTGGAGFGPYIIKLDGTEAIRVSSYTINVPTITKAFSLITSTRQSYTSYIVQFVGLGREQGRIDVGDEESCKKVLNILRQRFPEVAGSYSVS